MSVRGPERPAPGTRGGGDRGSDERRGGRGSTTLRGEGGAPRGSGDGAAPGRFTRELDALTPGLEVGRRRPPPRPRAALTRASGGSLADLLRRHLDPLSVRLRGPAIDALVRRLGDRGPADALVAIPRLIAALRREHAAIGRRHAALEAEVAAAETPEARRDALARAIVRETPPGRRRRADLRALRRWLDVEAIGERVARQLDDLEVEIELAIRLAAAILVEEGAEEPREGEAAGDGAGEASAWPATLSGGDAGASRAREAPAEGARSPGSASPEVVRAAVGPVDLDVVRAAAGSGSVDLDVDLDVDLVRGAADADAGERPASELDAVDPEVEPAASEPAVVELDLADVEFAAGGAPPPPPPGPAPDVGAAAVDLDLADLAPAPAPPPAPDVDASAVDLDLADLAPAPAPPPAPDVDASAVDLDLADLAPAPAPPPAPDVDASAVDLDLADLAPAPAPPPAPDVDAAAVDLDLADLAPAPAPPPAPDVDAAAVDLDLADLAPAPAPPPARDLPPPGERDADAPRWTRRPRSALHTAARPQAEPDPPRPRLQVAGRATRPWPQAVEEDAPRVFRRAPSTARTAAESRGYTVVEVPGASARPLDAPIPEADRPLPDEAFLDLPAPALRIPSGPEPTARFVSVEPVSEAQPAAVDAPRANPRVPSEPALAPRTTLPRVPRVTLPGAPPGAPRVTLPGAPRVTLPGAHRGASPGPAAPAASADPADPAAPRETLPGVAPQPAPTSPAAVDAPRPAPRRRSAAHAEGPGDVLLHCLLGHLTWLPRFTLRIACLEALGALADASQPSIAELDVIALAAALRGRLDDPSEHPWVVAAAARLLLRIAPRAALPAIAGRLGHHAPGRRDFLARRLFVDVIAEFALGEGSAGRRRSPRVDPRDLGGARLQARDVLLRRPITADPSELVRIGLVQAAAALARVDGRGVDLLRRAGDPDHEPSHCVRGHAARAAAALEGAAGARLLAAWLPREPHELVLRIACEAVGELAERLVAPPARGPGDMTYTALIRRMSEGQVLQDMSQDTDESPPRGPASAAAADGLAALAAALARLAARGDRPAAVHEAAASALEAIDRVCDPARRAWTAAIAAALAATRPGGVARVDLRRRDLPGPGDERWLGRVLADLARDGWGLDARITRGRLVIRRGDRFRPRLWRLLHELRSPGAGKRQAHSHVRGRVLHGTLRAHSGRLHEVTATTVPGERVQVEREGGWGRHLPLVDDLLGLPLRGDRPLRIASSFGITEVRWSHHDIRRRLIARARITLRYAWLCELRRQALAADEFEARGRYAAALRSYLGILLDFRAYPHPRHALQDLPLGVAGLPPAIPGPPRPIPEQLLALFAPAPAPPLSAAAPAVPRAAAAATAVVFAPEIIEYLGPHLTYFLSLVGNNQRALVHFLAGLAGVFFVLAHVRRRSIARDRASIPLVIGGWGTRGKSGTERLKAALFHGLGYRVFAKTTGCEAMFIHAAPRAPALEIYTFRPYGKATIWEQRTLLSLAARMGSDVFLWECMALSPTYVEIMQHEWMRDDLSTITNCYPDHEDIQGPAGYDVAEAIAGFVPGEATAITSEINFAPILREAARRRRSRLRELDPFAGDLVPQDLLALFPYDEHPRNVALVARLAVELGVDPHLAISTMAEHVIPDLGVLKRFGPARVRGRVLSFVNGCSANERTGFLSNWRRTGCEALDLGKSPGDYIITVVNNRDDRIARSQVFAQVMVEDVAVDRHLLIGTNLSGLVGYVREALAAFLAAVTVAGPDDLAKGTAGRERAEARLGRLLGRLRLIAADPAPLFAQLQIYAAALGLDLVDARAEVEARSAPLLAADPAASVRLDEVLGEVRAALAGLVAGALEAAPRFADGPADLPELVGPPTAREVCDHFLRQLARAAVGARLHARLRAAFAAGEAALVAFHDQLRAAYTELYMELVDVVDDSHATGDQVILRAALAAPPGVRVTLMGTQNIKGTGLDFVYRWIALDAAQQAIARLQGPDLAGRREALTALAYPRDAGLLDAGLVAATLERRTPHPAEEELQARALAGAQATHRARLEALARSAGERSRWAGVLGWLEGWIDFLDGARRYHVARRVMEDLVHGRISRARAAMEMRALDARAKGGWLVKALRG